VLEHADGDRDVERVVPELVQVGRVELDVAEVCLLHADVLLVERSMPTISFVEL